jgi:hypothetical protein
MQTAARRQLLLPQSKGFALNNNRIAIPKILSHIQLRQPDSKNLH